MFKKIVCFATSIVFCVAAVAQADLFVNAQGGTMYRTDGFTGFTTQSADMVGLQVTVTFADNSEETIVWGASGAFGSGWSLTQGPGSTFSNPFSLDNDSGMTVMNLLLHGGGTTTLFDRSVNPSTPGTANGRDLFETSGYSGSQDINVTYFDYIKVSGSLPIGDIYAGLNIEFENGIASGSSNFEFITDTDTSTTLLYAVPEPASFVVIPTILVFAFRRNRKNRGKN